MGGRGIVLLTPPRHHDCDDHDGDDHDRDHAHDDQDDDDGCGWAGGDCTPDTTSTTLR